MHGLSKDLERKVTSETTTDQHTQIGFTIKFINNVAIVLSRYTVLSKLRPWSQ